LLLAAAAIEVEWALGFRHLMVRKGTRLTSDMPQPIHILKGVTDRAILLVLGPEISKAIAASTMRKRELDLKGECKTECVSMRFACKPREGAYINLCLNLKEGLKIRDKLYLLD